MFADQRFMDATAARLNQRNIVYVPQNKTPTHLPYRRWMSLVLITAFPIDTPMLNAMLVLCYRNVGCS